MSGKTVEFGPGLPARRGARRRISRGALLICLLGIAVLVAACGGAPATPTPTPPLHSLPNRGIFVKRPYGLPFYQELSGRRVENLTGGYSVIPDASPLLLVWLPDFAPSGWHLVHQPEGSTGLRWEDVLFAATASADGVWELRPKARLEGGFHCLVNGDPTLAQPDNEDPMLFYCWFVE